MSDLPEPVAVSVDLSGLGGILLFRSDDAKPYTVCIQYGLNEDEETDIWEDQPPIACGEVLVKVYATNPSTAIRNAQRQIYHTIITGGALHIPKDSFYVEASMVFEGHVDPVWPPVGTHSEEDLNAIDKLACYDPDEDTIPAYTA